jgi:hypothetical protein
LIGYEVLRERFQLDGYVHFDLRAFVPSIADVVPALFTLLVFDTSARRIPHFVSAVTAPARRRRITAVARYRA